MRDDISDRTAPAVATARANTIGILAMVGAMGAFVVNDTCVKIASATLPLGEIITGRNVVAALLLLAAMAATGGLVWPRVVPVRLMAVRTVGEIGGTLAFLMALVALPIADVTAIAQVAPLALTATAALLLREPVGWRRWLATVVGLLGVTLIVRPGSAAFSPAGALALLCVAFVVMRDIGTRLVSRDVSTGFLSVTSAVAGIVAGLALLPFETWRVPTVAEAGIVVLAAGALATAFVLLVIGLRTGDVGLVSPFRYTVILFAIVAGMVVWGERPDGLALLGIGIVCGAGLYTLHRERVRARVTAGR